MIVSYATMYLIILHQRYCMSKKIQKKLTYFFSETQTANDKTAHYTSCRPRRFGFAIYRCSQFDEEPSSYPDKPDF